MSERFLNLTEENLDWEHLCCQSVELVRKTCEELEAPCTLIPVDTLEKAKALPCVFNNWAVFYRGKFVTVNLLDAAALNRLLKQ